MADCSNTIAQHARTQTQEAAKLRAPHEWNVDAGTARGLTVKPFIGLQGWTIGTTPVRDFIQRCGVGSTDALTEGDTSEDATYRATIVTRPFAPAGGGLLTKIGVMAGVLLARAASGVRVSVRAVRNFGIETKTVSTLLTPEGSEHQVIRSLDDLSFSDMHTLQVGLGDYGTVPGGLWELNELALKMRQEETA